MFKRSKQPRRRRDQKKAGQTLKLEIDDEALGRIYGHKSNPFPVKKGQKIAVRVISQFGEETTKVTGWLILEWPFLVRGRLLELN
jgi:hypothetical protein